jgi:hypothetical protein
MFEKSKAMGRISLTAGIKIAIISNKIDYTNKIAQNKTKMGCGAYG